MLKKHKTSEIITSALDTSLFVFVMIILYFFTQNFTYAFVSYLHVFLKRHSLTSMITCLECIILLIGILAIFILVPYKSYTKNFDLKNNGFRKLFSHLKTINFFKLLKNSLLAVTSALIAHGVLVLISMLIHQTAIGTNQNNINNMMSNAIGIQYVIILTLILAPISEEVITRYLLLGYFKNKLMRIYSDHKNKSLEKNIDAILIIISASFFSFLHTPNNLILFLDYFIIGLCFCFAYIKFNDIRASIFTHFLYNLTVLIISTI